MRSRPTNIASLPHPPQAAGSPPQPRRPALARGEKAKARDILAAIRTLQQVEQRRPPADGSGRFLMLASAASGRWPCRSFPIRSPAVTRTRWQALGDELDSLLTPEEYDSAKRPRSTPSIRRLSSSPPCTRPWPASAFPADAPCSNPVAARAISWPGPGGHAIHRRRAGFHLRPHRPALHPDHDIRIENFRDTRLPDDSLDAVIGNVPFADVKLDYRGRSCRCMISSSPNRSTPSNPAASWRWSQRISRWTSRTPPSASTWPARRISWGRSACRPTPSRREGTAVVTDIVFLRKRAPANRPRHADPDWLNTAPLDDRRRRTSRSTAIS